MLKREESSSSTLWKEHNSELVLTQEISTYKHHVHMSKLTIQWLCIFILQNIALANFLHRLLMWWYLVKTLKRNVACYTQMCQMLLCDRTRVLTQKNEIVARYLSNVVWNGVGHVYSCVSIKCIKGYKILKICRPSVFTSPLYIKHWLTVLLNQNVNCSNFHNNCTICSIQKIS